MKKILTLVFAACIFVSCDKDDDDAPCTTNAASIAGTYKTIASTYKETPTSDPEDALADLEPCEKDDLQTFKTDGTYEAKDAGTVCDPSTDDAGTWSVSGTNLIIDGDPVTIKSFDCKTLVLVVKDIFAAGDEVSVTLQKQ
jgi:hypothetical protein